MAVLGTVNALKSFNWPWTIRSGVFPQAVSDADVIRANLLRLYSTEPGEDKTEPDFGLALLQFLFETTGDILISLAQTEILRATAQWEPRAIITNVTGQATDDNGGSMQGLELSIEWQYAGKEQQAIQVYRQGGNAI
jgi:phage baseplate assembly protein W